MVEYSDHRLVKKEKMPKKVNRLTKEWCIFVEHSMKRHVPNKLIQRPRVGKMTRRGSKVSDHSLAPRDARLCGADRQDVDVDILLRISAGFLFLNPRFLFALDRIRYDSELWCTRKTGPTWGNCRRLVISAQPQTRSDWILHDLVAVRWSGTAKIHHFHDHWRLWWRSFQT